MATPSIFDDIEMAPAIEVFQLNRLYNEQSDPKKVNLGVGAYRTDDGKPFLLPVVHTVENQMVQNKYNHEYLPVAGLPEFRTAAIRMILGENSKAISDNRVEGIQCLGGTGCIRLAAEFFKKQFKCDTVYVSKPTWGNHKNIFKQTYFSNICEYRYWDANSRGLDINGMLEDLGKAPEKSVVILHAVAHNPTGVDPTEEQWKKIADVCEARKLYILLDNAYQGFASGDIDKDAYSSRMFVDRGFEFFIAQSFSKNFGLYNERTGNLCVVAKSSAVLSKIRSQLEILVRTMWSNPPNHGGRIVATILNNKAFYTEWKDTVKEMADRIQSMRRLMVEKLREKGTPGNWDHIIKQIGMFCYTGLNGLYQRYGGMLTLVSRNTIDQVTRLKDEFHIYMLKEGRINMCAVTSSNVDYIVDCIHKVVTE